MTENRIKRLEEKVEDLGNLLESICLLHDSTADDLTQKWNQQKAQFEKFKDNIKTFSNTFIETKQEFQLLIEKQDQLEKIIIKSFMPNSRKSV